jgi:hypothetical protein
MKASPPYGLGMNGAVKTTPETVTAQLAKASGKAKARYTTPPLMPGQHNSAAGKLEKSMRAMTPGTSPTDS